MTQSRRSSAISATSSSTRNNGTSSDSPLREQIDQVIQDTLGHPALMRFDVTNGEIILSGTIFSHELEPLLARLRKQEGVRDILNRLHVIPRDALRTLGLSRALALGSPPDSEQEETLRYESNFVVPGSWTAPVRWSIGAASAAVMWRGSRRRGATGSITSALGLALLTRALFNRDLTQLFGSLVLPVIRIHRTVHVHAPIEDAFDFWRRFDRYPEFMSYVEDIKVTDNGNLMWTARIPGRARVRWESQVTDLRPLQRIAWKSVPGSMIPNSGAISFDSIAPRETRIQIVLSYAPPAGAMGYLVSRLFGFDPGHRIDEDLEAMRLLLEQRSNGREAA